MKSFYKRALMWAFGLAGLASPIYADENFSSGSLLPFPSRFEVSEPVRPVGYNRRGLQENIPSPSDLAPTIAPEVVGPAVATPSPAAPNAGYAQGNCQPAGTDYQRAMNESWADGCNAGDCYAGNCGGSRPGWFGSFGGLILGRANQSKHALSEDYNTYQTIMTTENAAQKYSGGFETSFGKLLGCNGCNAIQFTYWGLYPDDSMSSVQGPGYPALGIAPVLGSNLNLLDYNDGTTTRDVQSWMTTSTGIHYQSRSFEYNNVEINYLGNSYAWGLQPYSAGCGCGPRMQYGWLAGFRYFQFNDSTSMFTDYNDTTIDGDADELCYHSQTKNGLFGFQMGGQANWAFNNCWSIYGGSRAGVYNNHIEHTQFIQGSNGYAVINTGPYAGQDYYVNSTRDALAGIGQLDLGLRYNWGCRFSLYGGYRVVGIAGVATSDGQIADNFADPRFAGYIKPDQSVLLHGGVFGGSFTF